MRLTAAPIAAVAALVISGVSALPKITRAGRYLYDDTGSRFYVKGIAYQEQASGGVVDPTTGFTEPTTFIDPLAQGAACARDIPNLQQLTVNTIRVYSVNSSLNHDDCMKALSAAGIYTIIDLSIPGTGSISRADPEWTLDIQNIYLDTVDAFKGYDNVLAFNIGNEVVINQTTTNSAPFVKAAARDVKAYLQSVGSSALVGYASTDGTDDWRDALATYLACDTEATAIDLYGLNDYRWCGDSSVAAAYAEANTAFANYPIPAYFSEYGCIKTRPRTWTEVAALYGSQMTNIWSGGVAFSYFPTQDDFGMTTVSGDTVTVTAEFTSLVTELSAVSPANSPAQSTGATTYPTCPAQTTGFLASATLPRTPNAAACACIETHLSCDFTPQVANTSVLIGQLFDFACPALAQAGGTCADLSSDGTKGTYGLVASCDAATKLSYVFTQFYEVTKRNPQSCDFAGNATVNSAAPASSADVATAVTSCLSASPSVITPGAPSAPASGGGGGGAGTTGGSGGTTGKPATTTKAPSGAVKPLVGDVRGVLGMAVVAVLGVVVGTWAVVV